MSLGGDWDRKVVAALDGPRPGTAHDEEAFRYFLGVERARAGRANRPFRLLLVRLKPASGQASGFDPALSTSVFTGLRLSLRETDVIGWFRAARVAGAVLSDGANASGSDASVEILRRVTGVLEGALPSTTARRLRVRLLSLEPRPTARKEDE